jgi:hypothetical protein
MAFSISSHFSISLKLVFHLFTFAFIIFLNLLEIRKKSGCLQHTGDVSAAPGNLFLVFFVDEIKNVLLVVRVFYTISFQVVVVVQHYRGKDLSQTSRTYFLSQFKVSCGLWS